MISFGPIEKLGTIWWFEFFDLLENKQDQVHARLILIMTEFENTYSRFDSSSTLSQLNTKKYLDNPDSEILGLLSIATKAYNETGGVFNIAVGDYLEKSGYDQDYSFYSSKQEGVRDLYDVLQISHQKVELFENVKIDFGGFGKGYLIDKLAGVLRTEFGLEYFLINGGGDMYVTSDHGKPIEIGLQDPKTKEIIGRYELYNQAFASSSPVLRQWTDQEGVVHDHLVSDNNKEKKTSFVVAPTAVQADIWATTLSINNDIQQPKSVTVL